VNERKFLNRYQPQTLVTATMLCYIDAAFGLLFGVISVSPVLAVATVFGLAFGGYGIANDKKWGYTVAVGAAVLQVAMLIIVGGSQVLTFPLILTFIFDGALVCLLLHPESRNYQRIWFN
jgi:hypothetical protein